PTRGGASDLRAARRARTRLHGSRRRLDTDMTAHNPNRVGISGMGRAAWDIHVATLEAMWTEFRVVALCDSNEARRAEAEGRLGSRAYAEGDRLVGDGEVDGRKSRGQRWPNRGSPSHGASRCSGGT